MRSRVGEEGDEGSSSGPLPNFLLTEMLLVERIRDK